jgi:antitoxin (DNA-binding transcriptional repressor) of toxin-antitoxin stability system
MQRVNLREAQTALEQLLDAAMRGETVFIIDDGDRAVQLVPVVVAKKPRKPGSARGLITVADDFDAPLEDFDEYMP